MKPPSIVPDVHLPHGVLQCREFSPKTGQRCTMGIKHAGAHQVGGPYHTVETFVTKCKVSCSYRVMLSFPHIGESTLPFTDCWWCGHRKYVGYVFKAAYLYKDYEQEAYNGRIL